MLDIKWIRDNPTDLDRALANRGWQPDDAFLKELSIEARQLIESAPDLDKRRALAIEAIIQLDAERRDKIRVRQDGEQWLNAKAREVGKAKKAGDAAQAERLVAEVARFKETLDFETMTAEIELDDVLAIIPNVPLPDVPVGPDEHANVEYHRSGKKPGLNNAKQHFELGEALGMMDFEAAAKLSGSRFVVLKQGLARMERALGQFMLDLHTEEHGYTEVQPPLLVKDNVPYGTGQLPKAAADMFYVGSGSRELGAEIADLRERMVHIRPRGPVEAEDEEEALSPAGEEIVRIAGEIFRSALSTNLWLIPTAEVPLTNLVRESILDEAELPLRFTALTPCFRSEAGAAGKDTRGMLRQHQFDKVELVSITTPEKSPEEHERMLSCAEAVLKKLDLHYRVMTLSTGDMGFGAQKTYDIEVWLPGQATYREISSVSVCGDFQARRMQARYKPREGKGNRLVHTLNGSGVAVGRALIAVMENYQNPDGSIAVPDALKPYMRGVEKIGP